jgi:hypothetical protein
MGGGGICTLPSRFHSMGVQAPRGRQSPQHSAGIWVSAGSFHLNGRCSGLVSIDQVAGVLICSAGWTGGKSQPCRASVSTSVKWGLERDSSSTNVSISLSSVTWQSTSVDMHEFKTYFLCLRKRDMWQNQGMAS